MGTWYPRTGERVPDDDVPSAPTPGRPEVANLNLYADLAARMDAAMKPVAEHAEQAKAMARLRRVCAGEPARDTLPPPGPPPYEPLIDPFGRRSGDPCPPWRARERAKVDMDRGIDLDWTPGFLGRFFVMMFIILVIMALVGQLL